VIGKKTAIVKICGQRHKHPNCMNVIRLQNTPGYPGLLFDFSTSIYSR
jgi:hypothetical protein